jgi:hypothetical protein
MLVDNKPLDLAFWIGTFLNGKLRLKRPDFYKLIQVLKKKPLFEVLKYKFIFLITLGQYKFKADLRARFSLNEDSSRNG